MGQNPGRRGQRRHRDGVARWRHRQDSLAGLSHSGQRPVPKGRGWAAGRALNKRIRRAGTMRCDRCGSHIPRGGGAARACQGQLPEASRRARRRWRGLTGSGKLAPVGRAWAGRWAADGVYRPWHKRAPRGQAGCRPGAPARQVRGGSGGAARWPSHTDRAGRMTRTARSSRGIPEPVSAFRRARISARRTISAQKAAK
jgi:hypothetical protein